MDICFLISKMMHSASRSVTTLRDPTDWNPPGSVHGIFQARILEWVAISFYKNEVLG